VWVTMATKVGTACDLAPVAPDSNGARRVSPSQRHLEKAAEKLERDVDLR